MESSRNRGRWLLLALAVVVASGVAYWYGSHTGGEGDAPRLSSSSSSSSPTHSTHPAHPGGGKGWGDRPMPVQVAAVVRGDVDVTLPALGTVMASHTATVRARVTGQLVGVDFHEGQMVRAGEVLARIDPRPFQAQLEQASGQLARDEAQLANARLDLERYQTLQQQDAIARQQLDAQKALVRQYEGVIRNDHGLVDAARLQLEFATVRAPFEGRVGLRQVDVGNIVQPGDANGIVVLTRTKPVQLVFAIPTEKLAKVLAARRAGKPLRVEVFDQPGRPVLATGKLISIDNQVDSSTGTVKLKAEFPNEQEVLFPNQSVNVRLQEDRLEGVLLVPTAAIQRGGKESFVMVVGVGEKVSQRAVRLGPVSGDKVVVEEGLKEGERVVIDGLDKLKEGAKVVISLPGAGKKSVPAPANAGGNLREGKTSGVRSSAHPDSLKK